MSKGGCSQQTEVCARSCSRQLACKTFLTLDRHFVCDVICKLICVYNELEEKAIEEFSVLRGVAMAVQLLVSWCVSWCVGVLTNET